MGVALLFFSQLFWKLPPRYGSPSLAPLALTAR
jgi:hypothetical protein